MKKIASQITATENHNFKNTFVKHKKSIFTMKSNISAVQGALQLLAYGAVLGGSLFATHAMGQTNASMPRDNSAQAQFDAGGKAVTAERAQVNGPRVSYRRIDGISLSASNSNLPVTADEGLWRESLGLPIGSKILLSVSAAQENLS